LKTRCWNGWSSADRINDSFGISAVGWAEYLCGPLDPAGETLARSMFPVPEIFTEPDAVLAARLFNQTGRRSRSLAEDIKEAAPDVTPSRIISYVGIRQVIPGRQLRRPPKNPPAMPTVAIWGT
jgi:hypothetical protein